MGLIVERVKAAVAVGKAIRAIEARDDVAKVLERMAEAIVAAVGVVEKDQGVVITSARAGLEDLENAVRYCGRVEWLDEEGRVNGEKIRAFERVAEARSRARWRLQELRVALLVAEDAEAGR